MAGAGNMGHGPKMGKDQGKARRIRELAAEGLGTRQIADKVGCLTAYVRATRQRNGGSSPADDRYAMKTYGGETPREARRNRWHHYGDLRRRRSAAEMRPP